MNIPSAARHVDQHFAVAEAPFDDDFSPGAGMLRVSGHDTARGTWWSGDFVDYRGIVSVQMEDRYTRLDAVAGGRCHVRNWQRGFTDRTLAKLCRAFLTDLFGAPASGTLTEGGDVEQAPSDSLSGPTGNAGDAQ